MQQVTSRNVITGDEALAILFGLVDLETLEQIEYVNSCGLGSIVGDMTLGNEEIADQFSACVAALSHEFQKGKRSELKVDYALSNSTHIYITLDSFRAWAIGKVLPAKLPGGAQSTVLASSPAPLGHATKRKPRTRLRDQEDAILAEIRKQGLDPMALPKYGPNKDGGKAVVFGPLMNSPLFEGETTLKKAWERLSKHRRIAYES